jgi:site-specific DNA-methyltransferase (adenine-specific)
MVEILNVDCMEYMATLPDKAFQLAIVDPPYGIGEDGLKNHSRGNCAKPTLYMPKKWDRETVTAKYISELRRVTRHQIIWGANHFISKIALDSPSWIVWDKQNGENDFADCELAWTSHSSAVRQFTFRWAGMLQGNMSNKENRIHPTQKPVQLYKWLLKNYAKEGDRILDTHLGSGSSAIAAYDGGFDFVGCEIDADYYTAAKRRFEYHRMQLKLL